MRQRRSQPLRLLKLISQALLQFLERQVVYCIEIHDRLFPVYARG